MAPLIVLAAHGTADPTGLATLEQVRAEVAARLSSATVRLGFVDVAQPRLEQVLAETTAAVVVPLFIGNGYHVQVDLVAACRAVGAVLATHLGAAPTARHTGLVGALADRAGSVSLHPGGLAFLAAGSSRWAARADLQLVAARVGELLGVPHQVGFLSGPGPSGPEAIEAVTARVGARSSVVAVPLLLAQGYFARRAADVTNTAGIPLAPVVGAHHLLIDQILDRVAASAVRRDADGGVRTGPSVLSA